MKKYILAFIIFLLIGAGVFYWNNLRGAKNALLPPKQNISKIFEESGGEIVPGVNDTNFPLSVPDGFKLSIFSDQTPNARAITEDPNGNILVSLTRENRVVVLPDKNSDGVADQVVDLNQNFNRPHGLLFYKNKFYIADTDKVRRFDYNPETFSLSNPEKLVDLPAGGGHFTRSIVAKDDILYISTGSSCNVCIESNPFRAAIAAYNLPDGSTQFATGLRNSVFMDIHPVTNQVWATDNGRDLLGDNTPEEEINIIKPGNFYGWPYCYENKVLDKTFQNSASAREKCETSTPPHITMQAHSAPLGLKFVHNNAWPQNYQNNLLVAYHGSWNRTVPTGYKIVRFNLDREGNEIGREDFIAGWLTQDGESIGRPVDIYISQNGSAYISDDAAGVTYLLEVVQ